MMKKALSLFLVLSICLTFTGCWSYKELDEMEIVAGLAIDKSKEGKYLITAEFAVPAQGGAANKPYILSVEGESIFEASRNLILRMGKRPYWNHAKVIIVSKEIAEEGIAPIIDLILREPGYREDIYLQISKEKTAREIFYRRIQGGQGEREVLSFNIDEASRNGKFIAKYPIDYLYVFSEQLQKEGISPILPLIRVEKSEGGQIIGVVKGTGVFKKDKMVGELNEEETKSIMMLKNTPVFPSIVIEVPKSGAGGGNEEKTKITVETLKIRNKIKPIFEDGNIKIKIEANYNVEVTEMGESEIDYLSESGRKLLEEAIEENLKNGMQDTIDKLQKDYNTDILGFGLKIKQKNPKLWKDIKTDWNKVFRDLDVDIKVDVLVRGSGLYSKPVKAKE